MGGKGVTSLREKVLIVEDEVHARTGLTELVASWGYWAEGAVDGVEAFARVREWTPALIVTDLKMPRMEGMELPRRLTAMKRQGELAEELAEDVCVVGNGLLGVEHLAPGFGDVMPAMRREQLLWRRRLICCSMIF